MEQRIEKAASDLAELRNLAERFVLEAKTLPQVKRVLLASGDDRIWVLVDTNPLQPEDRWPVYEAERVALSAYPDAAADFKVINLPEYTDTSLDTILPASAETAWEREEAA